MDLLVAFTVAMSVTTALIPLLYRLAGRMHVLDLPGERKVHVRPIPRVGGIAIAAGIALPMLLWLRGDPHLAPFLVGAAVLFVMGVCDDRRDLSPRLKFAAQFVAALVVVFWGDVTIHSVTLAERIELPAAVAIPLTVTFLVGVTNAINLSDGLDGLAGGTTLLCCCAVALLALSCNVPFVPTVAIILAGSLLGFLRYNTYPASVFMGDGGSQLLGFTVATLSVMLTQNAEAPVSAALPLLLLGLPILDTLTVMTQRLREGRSPFSADRNHLHHKLLARGLDHHEAVAVIYGVQAMLFLAAWFMRYESDFRIVALYGLLAALSLGALAAADRWEWHWRAQPPGQAAAPSPLAARVAWLREPRRLPRWSMLVAATGAAVYALAVAGLAADLPRDVALLAAALGLYTAGSAIARPSNAILRWLEQPVLYVTVVIVVYLDVRSEVTMTVPVQAVVAYFAALAVAIGVAFRTDRVRRFKLTTLDLLVVFVALALPTLPGAMIHQRSLGLSALVLLVLFYAAELAFRRSDRSRRGLLAGATVVLATIAMRGLGSA